ncbi:MAG: hypothetical protein ACOZNI_30415 [Myxococcota bacterium]
MHHLLLTSLGLARVRGVPSLIGQYRDGDRICWPLYPAPDDDMDDLWVRMGPRGIRVMLPRSAGSVNITKVMRLGLENPEVAAELARFGVPLPDWL